MARSTQEHGCYQMKQSQRKHNKKKQSIQAVGAGGSGPFYIYFMKIPLFLENILLHVIRDPLTLANFYNVSCI